MIQPQVTRVLSVNVFVLFAVGVLSFAYAQESSSEPPAKQNLTVLQEDRVPRSLGIVRPNSDTTFELPVVNTTLLPLRFNTITVGCACTRAQFDKGILMPGESGRIIATLHAENRNTDQVSSIRVMLTHTQDAEASYFAHFLVSANVRDECRWSHDASNSIRLTEKSGVKIQAANYGIRKWENVRVECSLKNLGAEVELLELPLDGDEHRQVAAMLLKLQSPSEPFRDRVTLGLYSDTKECSIKIGEIVTNIELPNVVEVAPRLLTVDGMKIKAYLIVNENGSVFDDTEIVARFGSVPVKSILTRRISPRWLEVALQVDEGVGENSEVIFESKVGGEKVFSRANVLVPK